MAAAAQDDDEFDLSALSDPFLDTLGPPLAYSPTTASLARSFGYMPSPAPSLSPLQQTPPHLRNISSVGVGLASTPQQQRRIAPYKGSPPTGPLLSSSPSLLATPSPPSWAGSPPSIGAAGVGFFSSSPAPTPPRQLGISPASRGTPRTPPLIGTAGVGVSSPSTPRRRPTVRPRPRARARPRPRPRPRARPRPRPAVTGTRGSAASSVHTRVARTRNTPATRRRVQSLQRAADDAVRGRKIAAVTETRTVTTTYKGNNQRPRVTRVSTRQTQ